MTKRPSKRPRAKPAPDPADPDQLAVEVHSDELAAMWRVLAAAVGSDSRGMTAAGDRHSTGASSGSAAPININVVDAVAIVEPGLMSIRAQAIALLRLDHAAARTVDAVIRALPEWHRTLSARREPLASHIRSDVRSYAAIVRRAIGVQQRDARMGVWCPEHRDTAPTELRQEGATATLARSLLDGPPGTVRLMAGPVCVVRVWRDDCEHPTCEAILKRRVRVPASRPPARVLVGPVCAGNCVHRTCKAIAKRRSRNRVDQPAGEPGNWLLDAEGELVWSSIDGEEALTWKTSAAVMCPKCKTRWEKTTERRMLARQLKALGDDPRVVLT